MSILITGIDMPTKGNPITVSIYPDGTAEWEAQNKKGTAVSVPPHVWVSVADGLPEDGEDVLCRLLDDNCEVCATVGCYSSTFKLWDLDAEWASSRHVTHWMPLPALS